MCLIFRALYLFTCESVSLCRMFQVHTSNRNFKNFHYQDYSKNAAGSVWEAKFSTFWFKLWIEAFVMGLHNRRKEKMLYFGNRKKKNGEENRNFDRKRKNKTARKKFGANEHSATTRDSVCTAGQCLP